MNTTEQAARTLWDYDNADQSPEWREMAWDDMGGSELCEERVEYELRARALADAGLLAPAPLREEWVIAIFDRKDTPLTDACRSRQHAESRAAGKWRPAHRWASEWLPADRAEGDGGGA